MQAWKILAVLTAVISLVVIGFTNLPDQANKAPEAPKDERREEAEFDMPPPAEIASANAHHTIRKLSAWPSPAKRRAMVARARQSKTEWTPTILEVLAEDQPSPRRLAAIELVGEIKLLEAVAATAYLARAGDEAERAAALRVAHGLEPWAGSELGAFLDEETSAKVLVAALALCKEVGDPPALQLIRMLSHKNADVRNAASQAMPKLDASAPELAQLQKLALEGSGDSRLVAIRALGNTGVPTRVEATLSKLIQGDDWRVRRASLEALRKSNRALADPSPLLHMLTDASTPVKEATLALQVIEATRSPLVDQLRSLRPKMPHPMVRLFAARCSLSLGDHTGVQSMIELLETFAGGSVTEDEAACIRQHSRAVLTEIRGKDLGELTEAWETWYDGLQNLPAKRLERNAPDFW